MNHEIMIENMGFNKSGYAAHHPQICVMSLISTFLSIHADASVSAHG